MALLSDVFDPKELETMVSAGYIRIQEHPVAPYRILNYTERAQFDRVWNDATIACRGLVVDSNDRVIARPFGKFFNYGEHDGHLPDGPVVVTEKMDGSLGILYEMPDGTMAVSTRGSFCSEQAQHATAVWNDKYSTTFQPQKRWTYLFEIIYPANRIVVNYSALDDLVLLGAVDIETGISIPLPTAAEGWPGPVVDVLDYTTLADALSAPPREGVEGCVVHFTAGDVRMKIKEAEYVRLHKLVTGMSERRVWEIVSNGDSLDSLLTDVPDEFYDFVTTTRNALLEQFAALTADVFRRYEQLIATLGPDFIRRDYALAVKAAGDFALAPCLFAALDGKDFSGTVWKHLRPAEHVLWSSTGND